MKGGVCDRYHYISTMIYSFMAKMEYNGVVIADNGVITSTPIRVATEEIIYEYHNRYDLV